jgi:hypothetical protein
LDDRAHNRTFTITWSLKTDTPPRRTNTTATGVPRTGWKLETANYRSPLPDLTELSARSRTAAAQITISNSLLAPRPSTASDGTTTKPPSTQFDRR